MLQILFILAKDLKKGGSSTFDLKFVTWKCNYTKLCNLWSYTNFMGVAEISKHFTGSKQCSFNLFLPRFTQLPAHICLKDCLAFSGNHKPLIGFLGRDSWGLEAFCWPLCKTTVLFSRPCLASAAQVPQVAALHLRKAPGIEGLF